MKNHCCAFVRVVQSNNGWTQPCGMDYGHGKHFASTSGFGFEEWMCSDITKMEDERSSLRLIHLEAFRLGFDPKKIANGPLFLWVNYLKKKYLVGIINKYELLDPKNIHSIIIERKLIDKLKNDIYQNNHLNDKLKKLVTKNLVMKLNHEQEKKFNLLVEEKDMKIINKEKWIELPKNLFKHNRFGAHYKLNEGFKNWINNIEF
jgi:hypothetical protein